MNCNYSIEGYTNKNLLVLLNIFIIDSPLPQDSVHRNVCRIQSSTILRPIAYIFEKFNLSLTISVLHELY